METASIPIPDYPRGVTFEQVWSALMETRERQEREALERQKSREEFDQQLRESREDFDRQMKESKEEFKLRQKETDRLMKKSQKEFNKRFGEFTNRFGEIVEYMIAPNLLKKFNKMGLNFITVSNTFKVSDFENNIFFEIDVTLGSIDKMMLVEIKTKLTAEDVNDHIERLEKMRLYDDLHGHKRSLLGAVAGVVMTPLVKEYALKQGFYVIEPSGETFNITPPNGQPKEW